MNKTVSILGIIGYIILLGILLFFTLTPAGVGCITEYGVKLGYTRDKALESSYKSQREVDEKARALKAAYIADRDNICVFGDPEATTFDAQTVAALLVRVNNNVAQWYEFMTQAPFQWKDNLPEDLRWWSPRSYQSVEAVIDHSKTGFY